MILVKAGDKIPLALKIPDGNSSVFVGAVLKDALGVPIGGVVALGLLSNGMYIDNSVTMPSTRIVRAEYTVYTDIGMLIPAPGYYQGVDTFELDEVLGLVGTGAVLVGSVADTLAGVLEEAELTGLIEEAEPLEADLEDDTVAGVAADLPDLVGELEETEMTGVIEDEE